MTDLRVVPSSVQAGKRRYPKRKNRPEVAKWRNNLTALSQYRNFLFIAYRDQIHVFAPRYPEQTLSEKPELIIDLPTSRRGLPGYIEHECPHAVNHLIVADLGKEEILVVACDDGDVISYMTRSIGLVIDQSIPLRKPWFSQNVGASAWGLAVHTQACLLAVSSNSHRIEVFAPSLWHHESCDQMLDKCRPQCEDYVESQLCSCDGHWMQMLSDMPGHRLNSWKFSLSAHFSNVPNLAFCNSDLDREGRFLVSTDIENNTFVWDIYLGHVVHEIEESLPSQRGWGVACLDPRTSRLIEEEIEGHYIQRDTYTSIDNSNAAKMVPHDWSGNPSPRQDPGDSTESDLESVAADSDPGSDHASDEGLSADPMDSNPTSVQNPLGLPGSGQDSNNTPESVNADPDDSSETIDLGQQLDQLDGLNDEQFSPSGSISEIMANFHAASTSGYGPLNINSSLFALGAGNQPGVGLSSQLAQSAPAVGFRDLRKRGNGPSQVSNRLLRPTYDLERLANQVVDRKMPKLVQLPFNTLQTTEGAIHIFSDIQYRTDEQSRAKVAPHLRVMAHGALHQRLTNAQHHGDHPQRLNMIHQIPELGVILVGNQAGRVGILTATRFEELKQSGYNFEYILPFKSQRDLKLQPSAPLMGIAVGPIQGQENRPEPGSTQDMSGEGAPRPEIRWNPPRRFRLLMVYKDHAVFSYEISRPTGDDILGV